MAIKIELDKLIIINSKQNEDSEKSHNNPFVMVGSESTQNATPKKNCC